MRIYKAPRDELKSFLVETLPKLSGLERLESQDLAKLLISKSERKVPFNTNEIGESFSWLHKIGVLDYDQKYLPSGGWRLFLFRKCGESEVEALINKHGDTTVDEQAKPKKKPCCDDVKIVKSKKTGKRFCKNCGTEHPKKKKKPKTEYKPAASAPCCDNPRPVKSKKTGKRFCKNCKTPLKAKKKK